MSTNAGNGPTNAPTLVQSGNGSATFAWNVVEEDGPATYNVLLKVADAAGAVAEVTFRVAVAVTAPAISISPTLVEEGDLAKFTVSLSKPARETITVDYQTYDVEAVQGADYTTQAGTVTFAAGESTQVIEISTIDDSTPEATETFEVRLSNPANAVLDRDTGVGTILDNDVTSDWIVYGDATVVESSGVVTVNVGTPGQPESGSQSSAVHGGSLLLAPGTSYSVEFDADLSTWDSYVADTGAGNGGYWDSFSISVTDAPYPNKSFTDPLPFPIVFGGSEWGNGVLETYTPTGETMTLTGSTTTPNYLNVVLDTVTTSSADGSYPSWGTFTLTQLPSAANTFSIDSYSVIEHDGTAYFAVRRSGDLSGTATIDFATSDGTATAGDDYVGASGTLTFADGDPIEVIAVDIVNDWLIEGNEDFTVTLSNPSGTATVSGGAATGTILDDDPETGGPLIRPPVACDDTYQADGTFVYTVGQDDVLQTTVSVKENDTYYGTPNAFTIVTGPANGTVTLDAATGQFTYDPLDTFSGIDSFTYKFTDTSASYYYAFTGDTGELESNDATVYISVTDIKVDIDVDSDNDGDIDASDDPANDETFEEGAPGKILAVGKDQRKPAKLKVELPVGADPSEYTYSLAFDETIVELFKNGSPSTGVDKISPNMDLATYGISGQDLVTGVTVYMDGVNLNKEDIVFKAKKGATEVKDQVRVNVALDLDTDSNTMETLKQHRVPKMTWKTSQRTSANGSS